MSDYVMKNIEIIRKDGLDRFMKMVPQAIRQLTLMLGDPEIPPNVKAMLIEMILDRGLGKPEETVNMTVRNNNMEEAYAAVEQMVEEIRNSMGDETKK